MKKYLFIILTLIITSCSSTRKASCSHDFTYSRILIFINGETYFSFDRKKKIYEQGVVSIHSPKKVKCRGHKYRLVSLCDSVLVAQDAFTTIQYYR